jgi:hypothetical protein
MFNAKDRFMNPSLQYPVPVDQRIDSEPAKAVLFYREICQIYVRYRTERIRHGM